MRDKKVSKVYSIESARPRLEKYCAYQERSHKQVYEKCRTLGLNEEDANLLLVELIRTNFLNEERFVDAYVKGKFNIKSWGKQKIVQGLKLAGVSQKLIQEKLTSIETDNYLETIQKLATKKYKSVKGNSEFEKSIRVTRYLISKGYSYEEINKALKFGEYNIGQ